MPPILASLAGYRASWIPGDALAALTLAAIALPEQIATARLIGLPAETGILAFAAGTIAFAVVGRSPVLSVGADSTIAPIVAGSAVALAAAGTPAYAGAVAAVAILVGLMLVFAGVFRLGWIADLLSIPVATGFLLGIAVHILVSQMPALLGLPEPGGALTSKVSHLVSGLPQAQAAPLVLGLAVLVVALAGERIDKRLPAPLIALALAAGAAALLRLDVAMIEPPAPGLPGLPHLPGLRTFVHLIPVALMVSFVCMVQTSTVLQAFSSPDEPRSDASRTFAAVGAGNLVAAAAGAFPVDTSPPRTAIVAAAGGRSQASGLLAVVLVVVAAFSAGHALAAVPKAALAGILLFIAVRLVRIPTIVSILRERPVEASLVAASAALVVLLPIEIGVGLSIFLSVLHSVYLIARPPSVELSRVPGTTVWWAVAPGIAAEREPGILVFALGGPLSFLNASYMIDRLDEAIASKTPPCRLVVFEASGVLSIDFTGARIFVAAVKRLHERGIDVALARLESPRAETAAARTGLLAAVGSDHVFRSVEDAVRNLKGKAASPTPSA